MSWSVHIAGCETYVTHEPCFLRAHLLSIRERKSENAQTANDIPSLLFWSPYGNQILTTVSSPTHPTTR
jgi:hypothetical protein